MRPPSGGIGVSPKAKKHKANSGNIHIDLEVSASIDLEKGVPLDDGVLGVSSFWEKGFDGINLIYDHFDV